MSIAEQRATQSAGGAAVFQRFPRNVVTGDRITGPSVEAPVHSSAVARARLYALFAEALSFPEGAVALRLLDGDWFGEAQETCAALPHTVDCLAEEIPAGSARGVDDLKGRYSALFDVGSGRPAISLLERRYVDIPEQELWRGILAFYTHFGLDFSSGSSAEQPDHLLTELSFMHYLCFLEAAATTGVEDLRRGQRDFLACHLGRLAAGLADITSQLEQNELYVQLVRGAVSFVAADLDFYGASAPYDSFS